MKDLVRFKVKFDRSSVDIKSFKAAFLKWSIRANFKLFDNAKFLEIGHIRAINYVGNAIDVEMYDKYEGLYSPDKYCAVYMMVMSGDTVTSINNMYLVSKEE